MNSTLSDGPKGIDWMLAEGEREIQERKAERASRTLHAAAKLTPHEERNFLREMYSTASGNVLAQ